MLAPQKSILRKTKHNFCQATWSRRADGYGNGPFQAQFVSTVIRISREYPGSRKGHPKYYQDGISEEVTSRLRPTE